MKKSTFYIKAYLYIFKFSKIKTMYISLFTKEYDALKLVETMNNKHLKQNNLNELLSKECSNDEEREINGIFEFDRRIKNTLKEWDSLIEKTGKFFEFLYFVKKLIIVFILSFEINESSFFQCKK